MFRIKRTRTIRGALVYLCLKNLHYSTFIVHSRNHYTIFCRIKRKIQQIYSQTCFPPVSPPFFQNGGGRSLFCRPSPMREALNIRPPMPPSGRTRETSPESATKMPNPKPLLHYRTHTKRPTVSGQPLRFTHHPVRSKKY